MSGKCTRADEKFSGNSLIALDSVCLAAAISLSLSQLLPHASLSFSEPWNTHAPPQTRRKREKTGADDGRRVEEEEEEVKPKRVEETSVNEEVKEEGGGGF
jgi:hypothetical protein